MTNSQVQMLESIIGAAQQDVLMHDVNQPFVQNPAFGDFEALPDPAAYAVQNPLQTAHTLHSSSSTSSINGVPAMDNWAGDLNFTAQFSQAQDKTKATPWIVSN